MPAGRQETLRESRVTAATCRFPGAMLFDLIRWTDGRALVAQVRDAMWSPVYRPLEAR